MKATAKIAVFDTTLRDGEQAAGTRLGSRDKIRLARQLARLKVDVIEAGFPTSSPEDFEAVQKIAPEIKGPAICALSRAVAADIEACGKALAKAARPRIHTGIGASDIHIMGKFRDERYGKTLEDKRAKILQMAVDAVKLARNCVDDVEFYAEDAGRADALIPVRNDRGRHRRRRNRGQHSRHHRLHRARAVRRTDSRHPRQRSEHRARHHQRALPRRPGPGGGQLPGRRSQRRAPGGGHHQRNRRKGRQRRAGRNRHGLRTRADYFGVHTGVEPREFFRTSRLVADLLGMPVPANKAVIGVNAFSHSSGIHVDGFLKDRETYEIMRPEDVGFTGSRVVLTARTGRAGLRSIGWRNSATHSPNRSLTPCTNASL